MKIFNFGSICSSCILHCDDLSHRKSSHTAVQKYDFNMFFIISSPLIGYGTNSPLASFRVVDNSLKSSELCNRAVIGLKWCPSLDFFFQVSLQLPYVAFLSSKSTKECLYFITQQTYDTSERYTVLRSSEHPSITSLLVSHGIEIYSLFFPVWITSLIKHRESPHTGENQDISVSIYINTRKRRLASEKAIDWVCNTNMMAPGH